MNNIAINIPLEKVEVAHAEFVRLLGLPPEYEMQGRVAELAEWARNWYGENGQPWIHSHHISELNLEEESVQLDGQRLYGKGLIERLKTAKSKEAILIAVSAGHEVVEAAQEFWRDDQPDKYYFLESYASAVVEHLMTHAGAALCGWAEEQEKFVLPHYSPGYQGWDLQDQLSMFEIFTSGNGHDLKGRLEVMSSGMLVPKKSQIALFAVTEDRAKVEKYKTLVPCERCSFSPCAFRRAPYVSEDWQQIDGQSTMEFLQKETSKSAPPLTQDTSYEFSLRGIRLWAETRLQLEELDNGQRCAKFKFNGSTCTNMGWPLEFEYEVVIDSAQEQYRILEMNCRAGTLHEGYKKMCSYIEKGEELTRRIAQEKPLIGQPLNDVLGWDANINPAGCLCSLSNRNHKWKVMLQTLHYAMVQHAKNTA